MGTPTTQRELERLVLDLLPAQGAWSEQYYLWLTDQSNHLIEFTDGHVELLPMPTERHQAISRCLFLAFLSHPQPTSDAVFFAPLRVRIRARKFREPDLLLLLDPDDPRRQDRYWLGADLVAEIVSPDDPERDRKTKRHDYAEAGIREYWIVDPQAQTITVLRLADGRYVEHGVFGPGTRATSALLPGFGVETSVVFAVR